MRLAVLTVSAIGVVFASAPVAAQNINTIEARLDRMEREMQTLSRSVFKGDVPPPQIGGGSGVNTQQAAQMEVRMNQIEQQLRRLTGMVEENSYRLRQLTENASGASAPINNGASAYQNDMGYGDNTQTPNAPTSLTGNTKNNQPYQLGTLNNGNATSPAGLYDEAFSYLQTNDYASAQAAFERFINMYPDNPLAANAKYWLGETYYAREDYQQASRAFARAFKDHPDGQKAPDTLLKLAMSLKGQDMTQEACMTLAELQKRFTDAPVAILSKASEERQSYGCE